MNSHLKLSRKVTLNDFLCVEWWVRRYHGVNVRINLLKIKLALGGEKKVWKRKRLQSIYKIKICLLLKLYSSQLCYRRCVVLSIYQ